LFDYFHSDAPIGVVRMDAVFRQVGLDAHFADAAGVSTDIQSLTNDWSATKQPVQSKVPLCHRVGGTATVAMDIDDSLSVMSGAQANDLPGVEHESENGATEIDTLELLFDCPSGVAAPASGSGSTCTSNSPCDSGQVCDTANNGGRCAPDP